jgi:steroid 5-alpha reductase family enzyme
MNAFIGVISQIAATPWSIMAALLGLALVISALGFYRLVYFISIGYAFSIVGMVAAVLISLRGQLSFFAIAQNVLLALWGLRLGIYLVQREFASSFQQVKAKTQEQYQAGLKAKFFIWVGVSLLYVAMYSPALFSVYYAPVVPFARSGLAQIIGLIILAAGLVIEAVADKQKSDFKKKHPHGFVNTGLYRWVRYPNYLGEIMVWIGSWAMSLAFYANVAEVAISLIGVICIILIMIGSTKRLEFSQGERYGHLEEYQMYVCLVPVLFPFVPVYTLKKVRVYLE